MSHTWSIPCDSTKIKKLSASKNQRFFKNPSPRNLPEHFPGMPVTKIQNMSCLLCRCVPVSSLRRIDLRPHAAAAFCRVLVMPNLVPPVTTTEAALAYRERILLRLPKDIKNGDFVPLMTPLDSIFALGQFGWHGMMGWSILSLPHDSTSGLNSYKMP